MSSFVWHYVLCWKLSLAWIFRLNLSWGWVKSKTTTKPIPLLSEHFQAYPFQDAAKLFVPDQMWSACRLSTPGIRPYHWLVSRFQTLFSKQISIWFYDLSPTTAQTDQTNPLKDEYAIGNLSVLKKSINGIFGKNHFIQNSSVIKISPCIKLF